MVALPAFGVFALLSFGLLLGIVILGGSLFLDYHLFRFTLQHVKSRIDTDEKGIRCLTPAKEELYLPWEDITHSGGLREKGKVRLLFIYNSEEDRFLKIPNEYSHFDRLEEEIRSRTPFRELEGEVTVEEYLKKELER
jgi:hypothetical protein